MNSCWSISRDDRPTFTKCQEFISKLAETTSPMYWERFLALLQTLSDDIATSYYNINQIVSLKRHAENAVSPNFGEDMKTINCVENKSYMRKRSSAWRAKP